MKDSNVKNNVAFRVATIILGVFSFIDGLTSAIDFMTFPKSIWGTIIILFLGSAIFFSRKLNRLFLKGLRINDKTTFIFLGGILLSLWIPHLFTNPNRIDNNNPKPDEKVFQSIFSTNDTVNLNVLILRFEDFIADKNTYCIGRSIEDVLNSNRFQENLAIRVNYADSILSPPSLDLAKEIQQKHNADLVLFGLANNIKKDCKEAEVCFRYSLNENLLSREILPVEIKAHKFDRSSISMIPSNLNQTISFDISTLENWVYGLYYAKNSQLNKIVIEIDKIVGNNKLSRKERSQRLSHFGLSFMNMRLDSLAIFALDKSISLDSSNSISYQMKGRLLALNHEYDSAGKILNLGLNRTHDQKQKSRLLVELGDLHLKLTEPRNLIENRDVGILDQINIRWSEAMELYSQAIELDSLNIAAYMAKGNLALNLYSDDWSGLMVVWPYFEKVIALDPSQEFLVYSNIGVHYSSRGNLAKALEFHNKAIENNPTDYISYLNRQTVYMKMGDIEKAINDLNIAISLKPKKVKAYQQRAHRYLDQGKTDLAILDLKMASNLDKKNPLPLMNLGEIYLKQNRLDLAKDILEEADSLDSRNDWLRIHSLLNHIDSKQ